MPHITVDARMPGIFGLFNYRPETAKPLLEFCEALLRDENSLSRGERELIAGHVSNLNASPFCANGHFAIAAAQLNNGEAIVDGVRSRSTDTAISPKMKALLDIATKVTADGKTVEDSDVAKAREAGAAERDVHDAVLIAAAFAMFNRYVDGLNAVVPEDPNFYRSMAAGLISQGYVAGVHSKTERQPS
ncbi:peroxidase-related enzyme [Streptomyces spectabilis]|uniref:Carboxymuconolactone decarboxylase family protein n=1 Tax=Streptomyces spectabilis TaxID=68270 RepID=A0A5P2X3U7_STRST|nr:peroxidase-related enzyme [Streptomyces spectabilis]MBB5101007.1 putative peroxidase-related enzyme [Streptomyces spectabilis]MCI3900219.1 peroxidase-related enzyme [Streptomyces spectabilis]QEV57825.1 carboxymuconolactone decarboxylase family protein [Streptomyces spectabilis]GGV08944.1 carboxymuconolactone decarboxylase [Streptomyces spectabilis]